MEIVAKTGRQAYPLAVAAVLKEGRRRSPRGRPTLDLGFTTIVCDTPLDALPVDTGRRPMTAIAAAEALQLIGGASLPGMMLRISPKFREFLEPHDRSFYGAYGTRVKGQMVSVANKLRLDPNSRQAVVTLWDALLDNNPDHRDYPCTVALQFQVEDGKLCMNTVMRSNDVWLGLPYDLFQFTQLQMTLARSLRLAYGWYRHTALSLHAYVDDVDNLENVHTPEGSSSVFQPQGFGGEGEPMTKIMQKAQRLLSGQMIEKPTLSEEWYDNVLDPYTNGEAR